MLWQIGHFAGYSRKQSIVQYNGWRRDTLGGLFKHNCEMCLFHWWSFFLVKCKRPTVLLKCQIIRVSELSDVRFKELCCTSVSPSQYHSLMLHTYSFMCHWCNIILAMPSVKGHRCDNLICQRCIKTNYTTLRVQLITVCYKFWLEKVIIQPVPYSSMFL